jgi:hypothetical protein
MSMGSARSLVRRDDAENLWHLEALGTYIFLWLPVHVAHAEEFSRIIM